MKTEPVNIVSYVGISLAVLLTVASLVTKAMAKSVESIERDANVFPYYMFNGSTYAPVGPSGFSGVPISELMMPAAFYESKKQATLVYLNGAYPMGVDSFRRLNALQLASFYNSLTFYYNSLFKYSDNDLGTDAYAPDATFGPTPGEHRFPLPYVAQGYMFDFKNWQKFNTPVSLLTPETPVEDSGSCRVNAAAYNKEPIDYNATSGKGAVRSGPGMFWVSCRTVTRDIWHPNGIQNNRARSITGVGRTGPNQWAFVQDQPITWDYPRGWLHGVPDNQYIEVTHYGNIPDGMNGTSPGWWYNCFAGTGIFLKVGRTFVAPNKSAALFLLAQELHVTSAGSDILMKEFGTSDPYTITFGFLAGFPNEDSTYDVDLPCGYDLPNKKAFVDARYLWGFNWCNAGIPGMMQISNIKGQTGWSGNFYKETLDYMERMGLAPRIDANGNHKVTEEGIRAAVDAMVMGKDYLMGRASFNLPPDEPIFWMGSVLRYDTLQMPVDANNNGSYVLELIDIRTPPEWQANIRNRDYSDFISGMANTKPPFNTSTHTEAVDDPLAGDNYKKDYTLKRGYEPGAMNKWKKYLKSIPTLTVRDPLDIFNEDKAFACIDPDNLYDLECPGDTILKASYCSQVPLTVENKCLAI